MTRDRLIIINADDETHFQYHEFNVPGDASNIFISRDDRISWIVFRGARPIGYRIDFNYVGTPFGNAAIDSGNGGISLQQALAPDVQMHGYPYTVTLENGWQDDPQGTPVDDLFNALLLSTGAPPAYVVQVSVNNGQLSVSPAGPYTAKYYLQWNGDAAIAVDFSASGKNPVSPFADLTGNHSPIPTYNGGQTTINELMRSDASGTTYQYTVTMSGITQTFQFAVA